MAGRKVWKLGDIMMKQRLAYSVVIINAFLEFRQYKILKDTGSIPHQQAVEKAYGEYEIYNRKQPIESDFDKVIKEIIEKGGN